MEYGDRPKGIDGIFLGGTMEWKLETMHEWAKYAHMRGIKCHVGRIGPVRRMLLAELAGADSIDSTTWVQRKGVFRKYIEGYYNDRMVVTETEKIECYPDVEAVRVTRGR